MFTSCFLFIFKQHLRPVYRFTIKQTSLVVIKRKAFRNHTLFCTFAAFFHHRPQNAHAEPSGDLSFYRHTFWPLRQQTLSWFFHQARLSWGLSPYYFFQWVVPVIIFWIPTRIKAFVHVFWNLSLKLFRLDLVDKAVGIHVAQTNFATIFGSHVAVMKLIH